MRSSVAAGLPLSAGPTASNKPPTPTWKNAAKTRAFIWFRRRAIQLSTL